MTNGAPHGPAPLACSANAQTLRSQAMAQITKKTTTRSIFVSLHFPGHWPVAQARRLWVARSDAHHPGADSALDFGAADVSHYIA